MNVLFIEDITRNSFVIAILIVLAIRHTKKAQKLTIAIYTVHSLSSYLPRIL